MLNCNSKISKTDLILNEQMNEMNNSSRKEITIKILQSKIPAKKYLCAISILWTSQESQVLSIQFSISFSLFKVVIISAFLSKIYQFHQRATALMYDICVHTHKLLSNLYTAISFDNIVMHSTTESNSIHRKNKNKRKINDNQTTSKNMCTVLQHPSHVFDRLKWN